MSLVDRLAIVHVITVLSTVLLKCSALDVVTVAPINPNTGETERILEKDAKKIDRLDISPEFYK